MLHTLAKQAIAYLAQLLHVLHAHVMDSKQTSRTKSYKVHSIAMQHMYNLIAGATRDAQGLP